MEAAPNPLEYARREPPSFRSATVTAIERISPWMIRLVLSGTDLDQMVPHLPAGSIRLLVPTRGTTDLVIPKWNGNEFLLPDGSRPTLRTFTPVRRESTAELAVDIVVHEGGEVSDWARHGFVGAQAAISGPGRGYVIATDASEMILAGDESAIPAISQLLAEISPEVSVDAHIELAHADAQISLPSRPRSNTVWHLLDPGATPGSTLIRVVNAIRPSGGTRIWAAGEAAAMQAIRRVIFDQHQLPRGHATIRGYWKQR